jgi:hypothetical protein
MVAGLQQPKQSEVVALGASAGKDDFGRTTVQQVGYLFASVFNRRTGLLPLLMDRGRVAKLFYEVRAHRLEHIGQERGGRIVVEVYPAHR